MENQFDLFEHAYLQCTSAIFENHRCSIHNSWWSNKKIDKSQNTSKIFTAFIIVVINQIMEFFQVSFNAIPRHHCMILTHPINEFWELTLSHEDLVEIHQSIASVVHIIIDFFNFLGFQMVEMFAIMMIPAFTFPPFASDT